MDAKMIKKVNDNLPDPLKKIFSPIIRNRLILGDVFTNQYNHLMDFDHLSSDQKEQMQTDLLRKQLTHAYETTLAYRKLFDQAGFDVYKPFDKAAFEKIQVQSKEEITKNFSEYISSNKINHYVAYTGGTTGDPMKLFMDQESVFREKAFIYHHWRKLGYDYKKSKIITFRGVEIKNNFYKLNPVYNEIIVSPFYINTKNISKYITLINTYKPDFFHGYPSAIKNFCRIMKEENIQLSIQLRGVFLISEEVNDHDRHYIENTLNCPSLPFYGHSERAVFGEEIAPDYYTFHHLYGYTELIPTAMENEYAIVATGFLNHKMPLIRYATGDGAIVDEKGIRIKGRYTRDTIPNLIGRNLELIDITTKVFQEGVFTVCAKCQFVQNEPGFVEINMLDKDYMKKKQQIGAFLTKRFKGVLDFMINKCEALELTQSGKQKILIQNIRDLDE